MNSLKLTAAVTALANAIACNMTVSELAVIAGILVQLGDTLATIAAQRDLCEGVTEDDSRYTSSKIKITSQSRYSKTIIP